MKKWISHIVLPVALLAALLAAASCVGLDSVRKMRVVSHRITGVRMPEPGSRTLGVTLLMQVENPAGYVRMSDIAGEIRSDKLTLGTFAVDDLSVEARCTKDYAVALWLTPAADVSLFRLMALLKDFRPEDYVFDVSVNLSAVPQSKGGRYVIKNQPIKALFQR